MYFSAPSNIQLAIVHLIATFNIWLKAHEQHSFFVWKSVSKLCHSYIIYTPIAIVIYPLKPHTIAIHFDTIHKVYAIQWQREILKESLK